MHVTPELEPSDANAGKAIQLDGVDDKVTVGASASLDIVRAATVELWFKLDPGVTVNGDGTLNFGLGKAWMPILYKGD